MKIETILQKIRSLKPPQKLAFKAALYLLIAVTVTLPTLLYINYYFLAPIPIDKHLSDINNKGLVTFSSIPKGATCVSFSYENNYYMYLLNGIIYIRDTATNTIKKEINEKTPIAYTFFMSDRNIVVYLFAKAGSQNSTSSLGSSSKASSSSSSSKSTSSSGSSSSSETTSSSSSSSSDVSSASQSSSSVSSSTSHAAVILYTTASSSSDSSSSATSSSNESSSSSATSSAPNSSSSQTESGGSSASSKQNSSTVTSSFSNSSATANNAMAGSFSFHVSTYNLDTDILKPNQSFAVASGSTIKQVTYSSLTYRMYVNIESGNKATGSNSIYSIKITQGAALYASNKTIDNMVQLNKYEKLYYQDKAGNIYASNKKIAAFGTESVKLVGRDSEDNIYVQSNEKKGTFYVLNDTKIINTIKLDDSNFSHIVFTDYGLYVVYSDYAIDLTKDLKTKYTFDKTDTFLNIIGDRIYLKNSSSQYISMLYAN